MKVFLSYSHKDSKFASELSQELENNGIPVWRDIEKTVTGDLFISKISHALSECTAYCVLISKDSMSSRWVSLELSAALSRWANDPSFKFIPVLLDPESLPTILRGMLYIPAVNESAHHIAEIIVTLISQKNLSSEIASIDWDPLLSAIERDQFTEPGSHSYGGWSRSYALNFLPLAYPNEVPESVAPVDSISVTHCVVRGLCSLRRILLRSEGTNSLLNRIERLLNLARNYLMLHYDGKGAGLFHKTTSGFVIHKDIRHSAKFARALLVFRSIIKVL